MSLGSSLAQREYWRERGEPIAIWGSIWVRVRVRVRVRVL